NEGRIVRFTPAMKQLDSLAADRQSQGVVIDLVRAPLSNGIDVARSPELLALNDAVQAVRCLVAIQSSQHVPLSDDPGPGNPIRIGFVIDDLDAARGIGVTVCVDHGVCGALVPPPDGGKSPAGRIGLGSVYEYEPRRRAYDGDAAAKVGRV